MSVIFLLDLFGTAAFAATGEVPRVLRRELYATAALAGAATTVTLLAIDAGSPLAVWCGLLVALSLRLAAMRWNLSLPIFTHRT